MNNDVRRARAAFVWVGLIIPIAMLALAAIVIVAWLPQLPDPVATHWGLDGADGFGPRWATLMPLLIGAGVVVLLGLMTLLSSRTAQRRGGAAWSVTARFLGAMSLATTGLIVTLTVATVAIQRDLAAAADAPDIDGWLIVAFASMLVLGVAGWFLQPRIDMPPAATAEVTPVALLGGERAAWFGSVTLARTGRITLGILTFILLAVTAVTAARAPFDEGAAAAVWILIGTTVFILVAVAATLSFRVRVTARGLQVRSLIGWPNTRIALADIAQVEVVDINPFGEFGGWGWRIGLDGRRGVVLRTGEGLQVTDLRGKVFVVTVDGAAEAAAVLEGLRRSAATKR